MSDVQTINDRIGEAVAAQDVVLFMKGTPGFPQCGFSGQVVQILDYLGVDYKGVNVLADDDLRDGIKTYSNWPTIPQLYVKGEFIGGCDIVRECSRRMNCRHTLKKRVSRSKARPRLFGHDNARPCENHGTLQSLAERQHACRGKCAFR